MTDEHRLTHIGLCVSDLARSLGFYCTALGFVEIGRMMVHDEPTATLLGVPDVQLELVYLERDGFRVELLDFHAPGVSGDPSPRPINRLGFTHLSVRVDDPDSLAAAAVRHGGRIASERTVVFAGGNRGMMVTDPDGNWIELIERPRAQD
ncbi:VOC family protein [Mycolicibacterium sp. 018/SC-01/001]|uniref:VOC family protein n=1 Tax=Mycolicibacterium sp. 018/SC-01/001 TaxID=2592069 RepID=UPI00117DDF1C|nr:VOC family protein [Mycolicibacterium sp. 018/SC-01/001]TRW76761.1 VOC family protein [Mycolicibacterium sp. 018/SC-01/001]